VAQRRGAGADSEDLGLLDELATACTVIGDYVCAERFAARRDRLEER
jgi:hypothetical protein